MASARLGGALPSLPDASDMLEEVNRLKLRLARSIELHAVARSDADAAKAEALRGAGDGPSSHEFKAERERRREVRRARGPAA